MSNNRDVDYDGDSWFFADDGARMVAEIAAKLAAMPTRALVATRNAMDAAQQMSFNESLALEASEQSALGSSHDYLEGVAAFMAKRQPVFSDR